MIIALACLFLSVSQLEVWADRADHSARGKLEFDFGLFHSLMADNHGENFVLSPTSLYDCFLFVILCAEGKTAKGLEIMLGMEKIKPKADKYELLDVLVRSDKNTSSIEQFDSDIRIYVDKDIELIPKMVIYLNGILEVFKTKNNREDEINIWISTKTHGMIKELLEKGSLTSNDNLIFVNAAHLKALWKTPFLGGTRLEPFTLNDGSVVHTPLMSTKQGGTFQSMVDNDLDAKVIRLPYEGDHKMAMVIVMPNSVPKKGSPPPIEGLVKKLTADKVMEVIATLENKPFCSTDVVIPRFEYEQSFELKKVLSGLRGGEVLNEDLDLSNLLEPGQPPVRVSKVFHKTRVNVYENGTLAAAASAVVIAKTLETHCYSKFVANRPFVYFIYDYDDKNHKEAHFIGILSNPKH